MSLRKTVIAGWIAGAAVCAFAMPVQAAETQDPIAVQIPDARNTVGIIAGAPGSAALGAIAELSGVADPETLRIVTIAGTGPLQNITDLLHIKGADAALVQTDVLDHAARNGLLDTLNERVSYLTTMQNAVFHLIASDDATGLAWLNGRRINTGTPGSGFQITANAVLEAAGVKFSATSYDNATALHMLKTGRIDAMVYVDFAPAPLLQQMDAADGLKLVEVPFVAKMARHYQPAWLRHKDYDRLIKRGGRVETVSVGTALVGYNWSSRSKGHDRLVLLFGELAGKLEQLSQKPYHPSWSTVTLSARLEGWERHRAARKILAKGKDSTKRSRNDELHALRATFKMLLTTQELNGTDNISGEPGAVVATE